MKKIALFIGLTIVLVAAFIFAQEPDKRIEGSWLGTLNAKGTDVRLVFNISRGEDGVLTATLDSPDRGHGAPNGRSDIRGRKVDFGA